MGASSHVENVAEPLGWNDATKLQLAMQDVAKEKGLSEAVVFTKFRLLCAMLPDLPSSKVADLVRASLHAEDIGDELMLLRGCFPHANVSRLVAGNPGLLTMGLCELGDNLARVCELMEASRTQPREWQALLQHAPHLCDAQRLEATLAEVSRVYGERADGEGGPAALLVYQPDLALTCEDLSQVPSNGPGHAYPIDEATGAGTRGEAVHGQAVLVVGHSDLRLDEMRAVERVVAELRARAMEQEAADAAAEE
ncbi:hypothetical protein FOA52_010433 [Chlamydomonas sp. UWO 241]|nr:hypothetical protein FOA52_010433 [Chlamydomonas sp. UWO 241]